jgi:hypothetical protein
MTQGIAKRKKQGRKERKRKTNVRKMRKFRDVRRTGACDISVAEETSERAIFQTCH